MMTGRGGGGGGGFTTRFAPEQSEMEQRKLAAERRQLKNLHLRTSEAVSIRQLLSSYADSVADERTKQAVVQQGCLTARKRANDFIMTHRSRSGDRPANRLPPGPPANRLPPNSGAPKADRLPPAPMVADNKESVFMI